MAPRHDRGNRIHCPFCDELIQATAGSCRYCGQSLHETTPHDKTTSHEKAPERTPHENATAAGGETAHAREGTGGEAPASGWARGARPASGSAGPENRSHECRHGGLDADNMPWSDEDFAKLSRPTRNTAKPGGESGRDRRADMAGDGPDPLGPQSWAAFEPRAAPGAGAERNSIRQQPSWRERLAESGPAQTAAGVAISIAAFAGLLAALFWNADDSAPNRTSALPGLQERSVETRDPRGVVPETAPQATARSESDSVLDQRPSYPARPETETPPSTADAGTNSIDNPVPADALTALAPEAGKDPGPDRGPTDEPQRAGEAMAPPPSPRPSRAETKPPEVAKRAAEPAAPARPAGPSAARQPPEQPPASHGPTRLTPARPKSSPPMVASVPPDTSRPKKPNIGEAATAPARRHAWDEPIRQTLKRIEHAESIATRPVRSVPPEAGPSAASQAPSAAYAYGGGAEPGSVPVIRGQEDLVRLVQRALDRLGYAPGDIDGQLGTETRRAIVRYQVDRGLLPNGWVDQALVGRVLAESRVRGRRTPQP